MYQIFKALVFTLFFVGLLTECRAQYSARLKFVGREENFRPTFGVFEPGSPDKMFVLGQAGQIKILNLKEKQFEKEPFLTVKDVAFTGEAGLLGFAFHPNFSNNGLFYLDYVRGDDNNQNLETVVKEYQSIDGVVVDPDGRLILSIPQQSVIHKGGWIGFGPDDYLYISVGDDDTDESQITTGSLLGKILRIDIDSDDFADPEKNYSIPSTNPFVGVKGDDEILHYGVRNPWRCSFDRLTGDFYFGDVGSDEWEEVNFVPPSNDNGLNFGWPIREGTSGEKLPGAIDPIFQYPRRVVIGGYVYRGKQTPKGHYFFADAVLIPNLLSIVVDREVNPLDFDGDSVSCFNYWITQPLIGFAQGNVVTSLAEDPSGNHYLLRYQFEDGQFNGEVYLVEEYGTVLAGDANEDGTLDCYDIPAFVSRIVDGEYNEQSDINLDGRVDLLDIDGLLFHFQVFPGMSD